MDEMILEEVEHLHRVFRCYRSHSGFGSCFRGQADVNWPLLPKAGRKEYYLPGNRDLGRFSDWKNQAIAYTQLPVSDIECMAVAQHHGLATRLLDWTKNPLVATYFAVNSEGKEDGVIYIVECGNLIVKPEINISELKELNDVAFYIPRSITPRVLNQHGMFTVHCEANRSIKVSGSNVIPSNTNLIKVIIPKSLKQNILKMLDDYGINESLLFPDLDGLSRQKNWETNEMVNYKNITKKSS